MVCFCCQPKLYYSFQGICPVAGLGRSTGDPALCIAENRPAADFLRGTGLAPGCITENCPVAGLGRSAGDSAGT